MATEFLNPRVQQEKYRQVPYKLDYGKIVLAQNRSLFITNVYEGPINVGPAIEGYGIGLSGKLMRELSLEDGQVVYFRMT
ncbi:unnamed protein product [marine sediment metagenome]|uniref:Uncharacterized protein n=1 Tax=marine sediment metagenome TaxID=412755 RepID=X1F049_9ZZZZ